MTLDEAKKIARIVETAEGGCGGCVNEAVRELNREFYWFVWTLEDRPGFMASIAVRERSPEEAPPLFERRGCPTPQSREKALKWVERHKAKLAPKGERTA